MHLKHLAIATLALCRLLTANAADSAEKLKVGFWTMSLTPNVTRHFQDFVNQYEIHNPSVKLDWALKEATGYWNSRLKR